MPEISHVSQEFVGNHNPQHQCPPTSDDSETMIQKYAKTTYGPHCNDSTKEEEDAPELATQQLLF
jgi:hypothetical protein